MTYIYRVISNWGENSVNWLSWSLLGGDYDSGTPYFTFEPNQNNCMLTMDITSLVRSWVNGTYPNYGVMLYSTGPNHIISYASKENGTASKWPKLDIAYSVPATSTPVPSATASLTNTSTATNTFTPAPTDTPTQTPTSTATFTPLPTDTPTSTPSPTATSTPTFTPVPTVTPSPTSTPTGTATFTPSPTNTNTPLPTSTFIPTATASFTPLPTNTFTPSPTSTISHTPTMTVTAPSSCNVSATGITTNAGSKTMQFDITNNSGGTLQIQKITKSWPTGTNGDLKEIAFGGGQIFNTQWASSPVTIPTQVGWKSGTDSLRNINHAQTKTLQFLYNLTGADLGYDITVDFGSNCYVRVVVPAMCTLEVGTIQTNFGAKKMWFTLKNTTNNVNYSVHISQMTVYWPTETNEDLVSITLEGTQIYDIARANSPATINTWKGTLADRRLTSQQTKTLEYIFQSAAAASPYRVDITTQEGCSTSVSN